MNGPDVVIVGGGLAGLAAGVAAADAGARVTLLEARPRLGGAAASFRRGQLTIDTGQHVALRCCAAYLDFLTRLGTRDKLRLQPRLDIPVLAPGGRRGRLRRLRGLPAPLHLGASVARFPFLAIRDRLRVGLGALALARVERGTDALDATTFGHWLAAHGQSAAAIERFWDIIVRPTVNLPSSEASAELATMVLQTGLLERAAAADVGVPTVPLEQLHAQPARAAIEDAGGRVQVATAVHAVETVGEGFSVRTAEGTLAADAVVLAVPHDRVAGLVPDGALGDVTPGALGTVPIVDIHVHLDRRVLDVPFAAGVDTPVQWLFDRSAASGVQRGQLLAISLSAAVAEHEQPTAELATRYLAALRELLPAVADAHVLDVFVTRDAAATFRQGPGSAAHRPGPRTRVPGLALAGAWTDTGWPATMEGAVRSGLAAAEVLLPQRGRRRPPATVSEEVAA